MKNLNNSVNKPHFIMLDGLRGVAALMVLLLHFNDAYGILLFDSSVFAVDFFFMLSGFVVAYSYQDRLNNGFSIYKFLKCV